MLLTKMCSFIDQKWRQNGKTVTILRRHVTQGERDSLNQVSESHINISKRKAMNRNWYNQKANPALNTKAGNK